MNYTVPAVAFLADRVVGVQVSGPRDDLPVNPSPLPKTCIIQAVPSVPELGAVVRTITYTLRFYAPSNDEVLAAYDAVEDAFYESSGDPITGLLVRSTWWLYSASLGSPGGPEIDPQAKWPVLIATAQMDWPGREVH